MCATCCRLKGGSLRPEVVDAVEHLLTLLNPLVSLCDTFPFVKLKQCDGVCLGGCGVSGMLANYEESVQPHGW